MLLRKYVIPNGRQAVCNPFAKHGKGPVFHGALRVMPIN
jgi:hypothetical protein